MLHKRSLKGATVLQATSPLGIKSLLENGLSELTIINSINKPKGVHNGTQTYSRTATEGMMSCAHPHQVERLHGEVSSAHPVLQEECCKVSNAISEDKVLNQQESGQVPLEQHRANPNSKPNMNIIVTNTRKAELSWFCPMPT